MKGVNGTAGASHAAELEFIFLVMNNSFEQHLIGDDEQLLAETMASYWINFARSSDPNIPDKGSGSVHASLAIRWEPFTASNEASIRLDLPSFSTAVGRNDLQCNLIDKLGVLTWSQETWAPATAAKITQALGGRVHT